MSDLINVAQADENHRKDVSSSKPLLSQRGSNLSNAMAGSAAMLHQNNNVQGSGNGAPLLSKLDQEVDVVFLEALEQKYECPMCQQVLRYPVQFEQCGHRCCSSCLPELIKKGSRCPLDDIPVDRDTVYVDKAFQRDTDNLGVRCSFFQRGCTWTGILKEIMEHLDVCQHRMIVCPSNCAMEYEIRFLNQHLADDCPKRSISCQFCVCSLLAMQEPAHLEVCPKFPVPCPNGCKKKEILREDLAQHLEIKCMRQENICLFQDCGCTFSGVKKRLREHLTEDNVAHLTMLCEYVKNSSNRLAQLEKVSTECQTHILETIRRVGNLEKYWGSQMVWKIDNYHEKFKEAKEGKKSTIFSIPFYTGRQGYRMALSALLYGDGKARGKFMSLFVCICKGEYDSLLTWPFNFPITLTLLDQCLDPEARRNVSYVVRPNPCKENKPFLGRPLGERNASIGAQKFVELELMNTLDYIRDDTIYIKVHVDITDLTPI